jgi:hypothetical protein
MQFPQSLCLCKQQLNLKMPCCITEQTVLFGWRPTIMVTIMPPYRCCSSCMRESPSSGGISVHHQSCCKYKEHMSTVWKLKNQSVALRRGKHNTTKGLGQTPECASGCQRREPECSMEILDDLVSLSPDLCLKAGEGQYLDHALGVPLKSLKTVPTVVTSTTTPPCAPPPLCSRGALTAMATVTALHNALTSSHKHSTMRHASRRILSQYLQNLRKAHPLLAATQSA